MNERIRLLADEAAKFSAITALPTGESGDKLFVEKFAELIVEDIMQELFINGYEDAFDHLNKYFGVE